MSTRYRAEQLVQAWNSAWTGINVADTKESAHFPRLSNKSPGHDLIERICLFMKDELAKVRAERKLEVERLKDRIMELVNLNK